jgi:hypothetical protein
VKACLGNKLTFATPQTILLNGTQLPAITHKSLTITGPAAALTLDANHLSRVFQINGGAKAEVSGLIVTGGTVGEGGDGYGGGICNNGGTLVVSGGIKAGSTYDSYAAMAALAGHWATGVMPADLVGCVAVGGVDRFYFSPKGLPASWALYGPLDTVFFGFLSGRDKRTLVT